MLTAAIGHLSMCGMIQYVYNIAPVGVVYKRKRIPLADYRQTESTKVGYVDVDAITASATAFAWTSSLNPKRFLEI